MSKHHFSPQVPQIKKTRRSQEPRKDAFPVGGVSPSAGATFARKSLPCCRVNCAKRRQSRAARKRTARQGRADMVPPLVGLVLVPRLHPLSRRFRQLAHFRARIDPVLGANRSQLSGAHSQRSWRGDISLVTTGARGPKLAREVESKIPLSLHAPGSGELARRGHWNRGTRCGCSPGGESKEKKDRKMTALLLRAIIRSLTAPPTSLKFSSRFATGYYSLGSNAIRAPGEAFWRHFLFFGSRKWARFGSVRGLPKMCVFIYFHLLYT